MTNPLKRGSAPGRERPDFQRPGSFKRRHQKHDGRKRGTPNAFSADYKRALFEAAYRIGYDGNGKNGAVGYFQWVRARHPLIFFGVLMIPLCLKFDEESASERSQPTLEEVNKRVRDFSRLERQERTKRQTVQAESSPWDWTGQEPPVGPLMHLAVASPKAFCTLITAAFLRPPTRWERGVAARRAWERRQQLAATDSDGS